MEKNWKNERKNERYFLRYMMKLSGGVKKSFTYYVFSVMCM